MANGREQGIDVARELESARRATAAGEFEHATDHLVDVLARVGATAEFKEAFAQLKARVAEVAPADPDLYGYLAGITADCGDMAQALTWAERAYALAPGPNTRAQVLGFSYGTTGDIEALVELGDLARTDTSEDPLARRLFAALCSRKPWLGRVPSPTESLVNLAHNILTHGDYTPDSSGGYDAPLVLKASALESPSANRAFSALFPKAQLTVLDIPEPDIRVAVGKDLTYQLWDYQGTTTAVAVPAEPSQEAAATLREAVSAGWGDPLAVFERSAPLGALGEQNLLGLLTHVPPAPDSEPWDALARRNPLYWPRFAQVWACLGLLHVHTEEPWPTSLRREILRDLLFGCDDWSVDAAANALATAAWHDPAAREEVLDLLMARLIPVIEASRSRATDLLEPLAELILNTPGGDPRARESIGDVLRKYRSMDSTPPPPEFTPDAIKKWGQSLKAEHGAQAGPSGSRSGSRSETEGKKRRLWRRSQS